MSANQRSCFQQQWFLFKLALVFLTRLPVKITDNVGDKDINAASGYFPLVGLVVGVLVSIVLVSSIHVFPVELAVLLSMLVSLFITGVFHEDGLADTADGFGGGWTAQQKLHIMKDSRLGTYGTAALFMALLIKFQSLVILTEYSLVFAVVALLFAHMISRVIALSVIASSNYVEIQTTLDDSMTPAQAAAKTKPVAQSLSRQSIKLLYLSGIIALVMLTVFSDMSVWAALILLFSLWCIRSLLLRFYHNQIAGYNGDVLGATQQVIELCCYLGLILWL